MHSSRASRRHRLSRLRFRRPHLGQPHRAKPSREHPYTTSFAKRTRRTSATRRSPAAAEISGCASMARCLIVYRVVQQIEGWQRPRISNRRELVQSHRRACDLSRCRFLSQVRSRQRVDRSNRKSADRRGDRHRVRARRRTPAQALPKLRVRVDRRRNRGSIRDDLVCVVSTLRTCSVQRVAFVYMAAVTALASLLAARYSALPIAVLGLIGGFLTPILLSTDVDQRNGTVQLHRASGRRRVGACLLEAMAKPELFVIHRDDPDVRGAGWKNGTGPKSYGRRSFS